MKKLLGANWKMNMSTRAEIDAFFGTFLNTTINTDTVDVCIAPQMALLPTVAWKIHESSIKLCTQNLSHETKGAFTGETSPVVLQELGVQYAIIGHGERRAMGETDELINKKTLNALAHGIRPILCIGEILAHREAGQTIDILIAQLSKNLAGVDASQVDIAYEPLWAIGTGKIPTNEEIAQVHAFIRSKTSASSRILYGGSANEHNAADLITIANVDGFLVGGASLDPVKFAKMIEILKQ